MRTQAAIRATQDERKCWKGPEKTLAQQCLAAIAGHAADRAWSSIEPWRTLGSLAVIRHQQRLQLAMSLTNHLQSERLSVHSFVDSSYLTDQQTVADVVAMCLHIVGLRKLEPSGQAWMNELAELQRSEA